MPVINNYAELERPRLSPGRRGFTLVELLVVILIIGILITLGAGNYVAAQRKARDAQVAASMQQITKALAAFGVDHNGTYPFEIRWFSVNTQGTPGFDPLITNPDAVSQQGAVFPLGLIGGVQTVAFRGASSTVEYMPHTGGDSTTDPNFADLDPELVSPVPSDFNNAFYLRFNQFSDPLVALGYLDHYPRNPFLNRPMGNVAWAYGDRGYFETGTANGQVDKTIPHPDLVYPLPGDFCYTHFFRGAATQIELPQGVVRSSVSYSASDSRVPGAYYLDLIDSYQIWAYGSIPKQGSQGGRVYGLYPRTSGVGGDWVRRASKDWDNSGSRDVFEIGLVAYYKSAAGNVGNTATDRSGRPAEF